MIRNRTAQFAKLREEKNRGHPDANNGYNYVSARNLLEKPEEQKDYILNLPPDWLARVSDVQYDLARIKTKMSELSEKHKKHLLPGFDDRTTEEHAIEILTGDITKLFHQCQAKIKQIGSEGKFSPEEKIMKANIQSTLASQLQELSVTFKNSQKAYLQTLQGRTKVTKGKGGNRFIDFEPDMQIEDTGFTVEQMAMVNNMDAQISQRERDILLIVKSITELSEIFRDLSILVIDQGTILDRIDYNLEQTDMHLDEGETALRDAATEQKKYRTKLCILLLLLLIFCVVIIIIIKATAFGKKS
jgi:syntaxin 16